MSGAVKSRTPSLNLAILNFAFPNWGDDANKNMRIIDGTFSAFGITITGAWDNGTVYAVGSIVVDTDTNELYRAQVGHVSSITGTFAEDRLANPSYWIPFTSEATSVGQWTAATAYFRNNIVFDGYIWAIASRQFISSASLTQDIADGNFVVIVDTSQTLADASAYAAAALASRNTAQGSATAAATSATNSHNSALAAASAEVAAGLSQIAAGNSASAAAQSAIDAAAQVVLAAGQVALATTQANNAANSATAASNSAGAAAGSATSAFNHMSDASDYADAALQSALDAANAASTVNFQAHWNVAEDRLILTYGGTDYPVWPINITGEASHAFSSTYAWSAQNFNEQPPSYYTDIPARLGYTPVDESRITISSAAPSGGTDGDLWFRT